MTNEISIYASLLGKLEDIRSTIEEVLPENSSRFIESGTIMLSEGNVFSCSIEPSGQHQTDDYYMSAKYLGTEADYKLLLARMADVFVKYSIVYSIDTVIQDGDEEIETYLVHPDFEKRVSGNK
ncbi:hypothetical protein [Chitinophaga rhizophila]|uniref:Uncharacterized protein n=1 Tax=Chitinophaga rhizophila TaxID=2866212 RepID=A0ABS7GJ74_9BACT|nr:hypothetical protein [Chitinophaga rhizophila]MBW8687738.1 hypothetical protein [Chitinophaga rhizophila]